MKGAGLMALGILALAGCGNASGDGALSTSTEHAADTPQERQHSAVDNPSQPAAPQPEPNSAPVAPDLAGNEAQVSRTELGGAWPLTVPSGIIRCDGSGGIGEAVFIAPDGTEYALNGLAADDYPDIDPIWRYEPGLEKYELRVDIGPLIDRALRLC